jgi:hypothetical protein
MTPEQLDRHRLEAEAIAFRTMVTMCAGIFRPTLPERNSPGRAALFAALRQLMSDAEKANEDLVIRGVHPSLSNLLADLYHEAFRKASEHLLTELAK